MKENKLLSQCMIVRDEEKNMERALSWGKGIVCEQIVVDTGSTDRTVEIAERMGARVFHFTWTDDFSEAKNYALAQATGQWVAFLDADEYLEGGDAARLVEHLVEIAGTEIAGTEIAGKEIAGTEIAGKENAGKEIAGTDRPPGWPDIIRTPLVNLGGSGNVISAGVQDRFFRNTSALRFRNPVHEELYRVDGRPVTTCTIKSGVTVYHTGYSADAYGETGKTERNLRLLHRQLEKDPGDYNAWSYLGDALLAGGSLDGAGQAYQKVIDAPAGSRGLKPACLGRACSGLMLVIANSGAGDREKRMEELYRTCTSRGLENPDIDYFMGMFQAERDDAERAITHLERSLRLADTCGELSDTYLAGHLEAVYRILADAHFRQGNLKESVNYAVMALRLNRYNEKATGRLLSILMDDTGGDVGAICGFLGRLYDLGGLKDKLFLVKIAKMLQFPGLETYIYGLMTAEEKALISKS